MTFRKSRYGFICGPGLMILAACSDSASSSSAMGTGSGTAQGAAKGTGSTAMGGSGAPNSGGVASGAAGGSGQAGSTGAANTASGSGVATGGGGASGGVAAGTGAYGSSTGTIGDGGTTSSDAGDNYPPPPRSINVTPSGTFSTSFMGQPMFIDTSKPIQGKLVLLLGGICTGVGAGGFDAFVKLYGFHIFAPKTDTCLDGGKVPQMYKAALQANPNDPEANRQIGDSRMELWDGKPRVNWYSVAAGASIVEETVAAIKYGMTANPHGDWGYFLDSNGSLRTSDVWVVGYSWGSQTWAMISAYVPFGRVITTSGPQAEGFPNALWITHPGPNGTPGDRKYLLVGFNNAYPSTAGPDSEVMSMVATVTKAGWIPPVTNVLPNGMGTYMSPQHLFAMVGGMGGTTPGGHTVFCNDNPANGWVPLCKYVLGVP